jgi:hypothetical protein
MSVYFPENNTVEGWKQLARDCRRRSAESFERCDTDGFLSQAANNSMASLYDSCAKLAEMGGKAEFCGVADLDGNLLNAEQRDGQYGWYWLIRKEDGSVAFFSESKAKNPATARANNAKKGYKMVKYSCDAVVVSSGFSGGSFVPRRGAEKTVVGDWEQL